MANLKTRYISDNIHGSISFSSLIEKPILADPLFNRLQGIKQNSTAYKTYPSLEHSRFIHSLGVMHLSTQVFYHSMVNTDIDTLNTFLNSFKDYLLLNIDHTRNILKDSAFIDHLNAKLGWKVTNESRAKFQNEVDSICDKKDFSIFSKFFEGDNIFSLFSVNNLEKENYVIYCIILQSIRICALFHDLGHPPFSHAVEFAVQDFYLKYYKETNIEEEQKKFFDIVSYYWNYINNSIGIKETKPFHESVTIIFIQNIFNNLITTSWENGIGKNDSEKILYDIYLFIIKSMTLSIDLGHPLIMDVKGTPKKLKREMVNNFDNTINVFEALKSIISGDIDADRLDYVMRDSENSGFSSYSFNITRIISNFTLCKNSSEFSFLTSIRSLNDTEKFLRERLSIYRYIIFHHNVVKTDLILYKILDYVFRLTILGNNKDHFKHWKYFWEYLDTKDLADFDLVGIEKFIMKASAWNEHWLISAMNISYQIIYDKYIKSPDSITEIESKLYLLLKEFLYNRRNLLSLWKRHLSFMNFADLFSKSIITEYNSILEIINGLIEKQKESKDFSIDFLKNKKIQFETIVDKLKKYDIQKSAYEIRKEKTKLLKLILEILYRFDKEIEDKLEKKIGIGLKSLLGTDFVIFIKIIESRLKTGVSNNCYIGILKDHSQDEIAIEKLGDVSSIIEELEQTILFSPQFHLYMAENQDLKLLKTTKINQDNIEEVYKIIIDSILIEFKNQLSDNK